MPTYLTGRTRTLSFHGNIAGELHFEEPSIVYNPVYPMWSASVPTFQVQTLLGTWSLRPVIVSGVSANTDLELTPFDHSSSGGGVTPHPIPSIAPFKVTWDTAGTWSITAPVEEVVEIDSGSYAGGDIGTQRIDPPLPCSVRFYERLVIGGDVVITVDAGSVASGSLSTPITSANQIDLLVGGSASEAYQIAATATAYSNAGYVAKASVTTLVNGESVGAPGTAGSNTYKSWDATAGALATASSDATYLEITADTDVAAIPPRAVNMSGVIRAMDAPYPDDLKVVAYQYASSPGLVVDVPSGSFSSDYTQQCYSADNDAGSLADYCDLSSVSIIIQSASLSTQGEDTDCTRLLSRGFIWNAMTMTQTDTMNVDDAPQDTNWTAGSNTTLADSGSDALTATISGGLGSLSSTLPIADAALTDTNWVGVSFCGYRFLRVMLTGDDDDEPQPASIVIGSKEWDITVGTTGYVDLDLCCPTNRPSPTDSDDSQWEWNGPAPYSVTDGTAWGISNVSTFTIKNLANGHEYLLSGIQLVRHDHTGMTFLPTYKGWLQAFPSVTIGEVVSTTYYRRARQADTDGRQSREDTDAVWVHSVGEETTTDTYSEVAISTVVAALHTGGVPPRDGWDATDLMPNPNTATPGTCTGGGSDPLRNCYLNSDRSSCYLFGSGAMYDGYRWKYGFDIGCSSTATIPAQMLYDSISDWYPGIGDVWGWQGGNYGGALQIQSAAILRGAAYGIINNSDGDGVQDVFVDIKDTATGLIDAGSGYSSSIGEYKTGAPCGMGLVSYTVTAESGSMPYPYLTGTFFTRHRSRFCFPGEHVPKCCDTLFCPTDFLFPFKPFAGDHTILPLDDYQQIPDVTGDEDKKKDTAGVS